ncbi:MAG: methyltransferase domain-containing protein [Acidimicrobiales bacterium]|nr:methyltransferase domain-containing protein [Acidimicrobiales bacterium]HRW36796.1 methyltransferase domain-containing protein [Aquihabitans sp.]
MADWRELNRAWWDERTPLHVASELYDVEGFKAGRQTVEPFEQRLAGDVAGLRLAHLQCHFGLDTMGWARLGASVVGLDFSQPAVDAARALATELDLDARFVCADVYDAVEALGGEVFDLVYTGLGAINWLPDLARWADVVAALVRPGGRLLLSEFHPFSHVFADADRTVAYDYFSDEPLVWDDEGSYAADGAATAHNETVEHQHTMGEILTVLLERGLRITAFEEHDHTLFARWPDLVRREDGTFRLPEGSPRLPLMFALVAERPG